MGSNSSGTRLPLENFVLDLGGDCLLDAQGKAVALRPRAWAILRVLALNAGRLMGKDELLQAVWPGLVVTDGSLAQAVSEVRAALGETGQRILKTVPRRGYLIVANAISISVRPTDEPYFLDAADRPSIAVLAFNATGNGTKLEAAGRTFALELVAALARNSDLRVVAHHASFALSGSDRSVMEIGRQLGSRLLADGHVSDDGKALSIQLELIDSETASIWWSMQKKVTIDAEGSTRQALIQDVARALHGKAREIQRLQHARPPKALNLYSLTVRGMMLATEFSREALVEGRQVLEQAIAIDVDYAPAWTWLGYLNTIDAYFAITGTFPPGRIAECMAQLRRAIQLDPLSAAAHRGLSMAHRVARDFDASLAAAERAVELTPSSMESMLMLSHSLLYLGREREALATNIAAIPHGTALSGRFAAGRAVMLWANKQLSESLRLADEGLVKAPYYLPSRQARVHALFELGRIGDAKREAQTLLQLAPARTATEVMNYYADCAVDLRERIRNACAAAGIPP